MKCLNPITLKSGEIVPCGKCDICLSNRRNEWSIRIQIHCKYYNRMPLMLGFHYDNKHLPVEDGIPTLKKCDLTSFIKAYKRANNLTNDIFTYYGCGEYGETYGRPHYHLVVFGDEKLQQLFDEDVSLARAHLLKYWQNGSVFVGQAQWSGIHYLTKYVLKGDIPENVKVLPYTISSKGLGMNFLKSDDCNRIQKQLAWLKYNFNYLLQNMPFVDPNCKDSVLNAIEYWRPYIPKMVVELDSRKIVPLPRSLRKRIVGQYQHFKDNPLWVWNSLNSLLDYIDYRDSKSDFLLSTGQDLDYTAKLRYIEKIQKSLIKKHHDKVLLNRKYESI